MKINERIARVRLYTCALLSTPKSVQVICIRKGLNGKSEPHLRRLQVPRPDTRVALQIFLHECAHYLLHRNYPNITKPFYLKEWEAESWSINRMRECNIPVPREALRIARRNVARRIMQSGILVLEQQIDLRAARFAWGRYAKAWLRAIERAYARGDREIYFWCPDRTAVSAGPPGDWPISLNNKD
jgi:hypothetical protein